MSDLLKNLPQYLNAWEEREDTDEYAEENQWLTKITSIEKNIIELAEKIGTLDSEDINKLTEILQNQEEEDQFKYFYILLNSTDNSLFDRKLSNLDTINSFLNRNLPSILYYPIAAAANYCDQWITESIAELLLLADDKPLMMEGIELVESGKLTLFESQIKHILSSMTTKKLTESDLSFIYRLIDTISTNQFQSCTDLLYKLLANQNIEGGSAELEEATTTLAILDEKNGWQNHRNACKEKAIYFEAPLLIGAYGGKQDLDFIIEEIDSMPQLSWMSYYITALGGLGNIEPIEYLTNLIFHESEGIKKTALKSIYEITGCKEEIQIDFDEEEDDEIVDQINAWWTDHKDNFYPNRRYRFGKLFSIQNIIDKLTDSNIGTREEAIRSLIIYTGKIIPFNENGFVLHMCQQQKRWQEWYNQNKEQFEDGYWYRNGKKI